MRKLVLIMSLMVVASTNVSAQEVSGRDIANQATNQLIQSELSNLKANSDQEWLKRTDISINMNKGSKPTYELETVQPFHLTDKDATFYQFRIANTSDLGTTTNLGLGYRTTSEDKYRLYGINLFYDRAWKQGHERVGLGTEYFIGRMETRANFYKGISGEKLADAINGVYEKVVDGMNLEIGGEVPNMPYAKLYVGSYQWNYKHTDDLRGYRVRSEIQLTQQVNLEVGYEHDNRNSSPYAKVMYTLGDTGKATLFNNKAKPITQIDNSSKLLDKVKRENDIRVERYTKLHGVIISLEN